MLIHVADDSATPTSKRRRKTKPEAMTKTTDLTVQFEISENDLEAIRRGEMLNDCHINSASALIKEAFPKIKGLQNTLNEQRKNGFRHAGDGSIQILYCGDDTKHWVTTCSLDNTVLLYDSLPRSSIPAELQRQIKTVYGAATKEVVLPMVQKQTNKVDCGCYAIAWALHLALGEKPENMRLETKSIRQHLEQIFVQKELTPFPNTVKNSRRTHNITILLTE